MSHSWNVDVSVERLEELNIRGKAVLVELQAVLTYTYQRRTVSEIARMLGCSRPKVIWMQHVLQLRTGQDWRGRPRWRKGVDALGAWPRQPEERAMR